MDTFSKVSFSFSAPIVRNLVIGPSNDNHQDMFSELQRPSQDFQPNYGKSRDCCDFRLIVTTANNDVNFVHLSKLFLIYRKTVYTEKFTDFDQIKTSITSGNQTQVRCFDAQILSRYPQREVFVFGTSSYVSA